MKILHQSCGALLIVLATATGTAPTISAQELSVQEDAAEGGAAEGGAAEEGVEPERIVSESYESTAEEELSLELESIVVELPVGDEEEITSVIVEEPNVSAPITVQVDRSSKIAFGDWVGYNATQSNTTWLAGGDFGMFSTESYPSLDFGKDAAVKFGSGFHFLNGPRAPDMPPRLFDFQLAFQARRQLSQRSMLDVRLGVGVFSDFETSARKGVRYPGHVVSYFEHRSDLAIVFGAEVLDRDDISVLPVAGFIARPFDDLVVECIFPRPRIQLRISDNRSLNFGGELGGGTWAIEREDKRRDNATYRDLRLTWGITSFDDDDDSTLEIGWAFDRSLKYRSADGDTGLDGAFLLRWHKHY